MRYAEICENQTTDLEAFLHTARQAARRKHCRLKLNPALGSPHATIEWIERRGGKPGDGADAIRAIVDAADLYGIELDLMPMGLRPKLVALYRSLGFSAPTESGFMARSPKPPAG